MQLDDVAEKRSRFVGLQQVRDHILGVIGHVVELWTVELKVSCRHVRHGLRVTVAHERRQSGEPAITPAFS